MGLLKVRGGDRRGDRREEQIGQRKEKTCVICQGDSFELSLR